MFSPGFALYQEDSEIWGFPWPFIGLPLSHCLVLDSQRCIVTTHVTASSSPLLFSHSSTVSASTMNTKNDQLPALLINTLHPEPQLYHWNMKEAIYNENMPLEFLLIRWVRNLKECTILPGAMFKGQKHKSYLLHKLKVRKGTESIPVCPPRHFNRRFMSTQLFWDRIYD